MDREAGGTVVYVHGMGGVRSTWSDSLRALVGDGVDFRAPHYADLLEPACEVYAERDVAAHHRVDDDARIHYIERQRQLEATLHDVGEAMPSGMSWPAGLPRPGELTDRLPVPRVLRAPIFGVDQVGRYLDHPGRRAAVIARVRAALSDASPPIVVLAHSLGSVVAVDTLADLPVDIELLVTMGSPLGHTAVAQAVQLESFPYDRVGGWVNVVHLLDPVPLGRGIAERFPASFDAYLPVTAGLDSPWGAFPRAAGRVIRAATAHLDTTYLATDTVRAAVQHGLHQEVSIG